MHKLREVHREVTSRILANIKYTPGKDLLYKKHARQRIEAFSDWHISKALMTEVCCT